MPDRRRIAQSARSQGRRGNFAYGRRARLHGRPREGPEFERKPAFQCEPELGLPPEAGVGRNSGGRSRRAEERGQVDETQPLASSVAMGHAALAPGSRVT